MSEIKYIDGTFGLICLIVICTIIAIWYSVRIFEYHEYSLKCTKCDKHYITRSRVKMFFIGVYHMWVCEWKN